MFDGITINDNNNHHTRKRIIIISNIKMSKKNTPRSHTNRSRFLLLWQASVIYFAIVFGIAFVLGTFRVAIFVPLLGDLVSVCIEMPIILTISWSATEWTVRRHNISQHATDRVSMGFMAFVWLMLAELTLSVVGFGKSAGEFINELTSSPPQLLGLIGQMMYGWMPLLEAHAVKKRKGESKKAD
jgi:hypothetical protein